MNAAFYEDLYTLCSTDVTSEDQADQVLDVLADFISDELVALNDESREICCGTFVQSAAYRQDLLRSRERVVSRLIETDKLQMQRLLFLGLVILNDSKFLVPFIRESRMAVMSVVDTIWTYRFTERELVRVFMLILFRICVYGELDDICIDACVSLDLVNYLYRAVVDDDAEAREPLMIIVALNDQYMLHDRRGSDNKVFSVLLTNTQKFSTLGSSLVLLFNRCGDDDQDLKIFISKFLYLLFSTPATRELLYTNDLTVLSQILIRELNDLPWEAVDVRAMYLRLLHAMLKHSLKQHCDATLQAAVVKVLQLTLESAENLPAEDRSEIRRLTERCLEIPWLRAGEDDAAADREELMIQQDESFDSLRALSSDFPGRVRKVASVSRRAPESGARPPVPPPPPPPPRHQSVASLASSSDSRQSLDAVEHVRPPPPPRRKRGARGSHD